MPDSTPEIGRLELPLSPKSYMLSPGSANVNALFMIYVPGTYFPGHTPKVLLAILLFRVVSVSDVGCNNGALALPLSLPSNHILLHLSPLLRLSKEPGKQRADNPGGGDFREFPGPRTPVGVRLQRTFFFFSFSLINKSSVESCLSCGMHGKKAGILSRKFTGYLPISSRSFLWCIAFKTGRQKGARPRTNRLARTEWSRRKTDKTVITNQRTSAGCEKQNKRNGHMHCL